MLSLHRTSRPTQLRWLFAALVALTVCVAGADAALTLPPIPADRSAVQDYARMLPRRFKAELDVLQAASYQKHDTPIVVVTIESMAKYDGEGYSIERFTREWFDNWQIGKRDESGELINQGILLLVSQGDRKARIELGADWGKAWDKHGARIMSRQIIPNFKKGNYAEGILAGVEALQAMAAKGPSAPVSDGLGESLAVAMQDKPLKTTPLPMWGILLMAGAGLAAIALSFGWTDQRKWLLIIGFALIISAFVLWVVLGLIAVWSWGKGVEEGWFGTGRSSWGGSGSSSFSSGGFGSGGFSGGGGASGSW